MSVVVMVKSPGERVIATALYHASVGRGRSVTRVPLAACQPVPGVRLPHGPVGPGEHNTSRSPFRHGPRQGLRSQRESLQEPLNPSFTDTGWLFRHGPRQGLSSQRAKRWTSPNPSFTGTAGQGEQWHPASPNLPPVKHGRGCGRHVTGRGRWLQRGVSGRGEGQRPRLVANLIYRFGIAAMRLGAS